MIAKDFPPSPPLVRYINQYRVRHFVFSEQQSPGFKPFPPRPEQCVVFYPRGMEVTEFASTGQKISAPRSFVSGQHTGRVNRYVSAPEFLMISVDLKPGALYRLTGIVSSQLTDQYVDAEALFSSGIREVNERLGELNNYARMIAVIEQFFLQLLNKGTKEMLALDTVIEKMVADADGWTIDGAARQAFLSPRQLERRFYERTGVCPKLFLRIARFNKSYWMRLKTPGVSWSSIAMACGYTDYQHMVRDYKEFANATPNTFLSDEKKAPGRLLGLNKQIPM